MCKKHPYAETVGDVCPYCRLTRMIRDAKRRPIQIGAAPDSVHAGWQDDRERMLGLSVEPSIVER
jgi:hypothetical protein